MRTAVRVLRHPACLAAGQQCCHALGAGQCGWLGAVNGTLSACASHYQPHFSCIGFVTTPLQSPYSTGGGGYQDALGITHTDGAPAAQQQLEGSSNAGCTSTSTDTPSQADMDPPRWLMHQIKAANSPHQLLQLVHQHTHDLNHIHVSALFTRTKALCFGASHGASTDSSCSSGGDMAKLQDPTVQQLLQELQVLAGRVQSQCGARELSNIMWASSYLQLPAVFDMLLPQLLEPQALQQQDMASSATALGTVGSWLAVVSSCHQLYLYGPQCKLSDADAQAISNTLWSAASMGKQLSAAHLQQLVSALVQLLPDAKPQDVGNTLWAVATMRQQLSADQLQQLLSALMQLLSDAKPLNISNALWALATIGQQLQLDQLQQLVSALAQLLPDAKPLDISDMLWAIATMGQQLQSDHVQQLVSAFVQLLPDAKPHNISNVLWAVARMKQQLHSDQLLQLVSALVQLLPDAKPQHVSRTLWAVAAMGQQLQSNHLQQLVSALVKLLPDAKPQNISNTLWAAATMGQQLRSDQLQQLVSTLVQLLPDAKPQAISNTLWAIATIGQQLQSDQLQQLVSALVQLLPDVKPKEISNTLLAVATMGQQLQLDQLQQLVSALVQLLPDANSQSISNTLWAIATMGKRLPSEHALQLLQLAAACSVKSAWGSVHPDELCQLYQVHLWLQDTTVPEGLTGVLTAQQLQQCKECWELQLQEVDNRQASVLLQGVCAALQQLPASMWQQPPAIKQRTADGAFSIDIAAVTAAGTPVAIEVDGPAQFTQPGNQPNGCTLYKNRALAARGWTVVIVPYFEWDQLQSPVQRRSYLQDKLALLAHLH